TVAFRLLALLGIVLSAYALYVEYKVSHQKSHPSSLTTAGGDEEPFVALCDIGWGSCSDVLTSESSHLFGPPNALLGVLFYIAIFLYPSVHFVPFKQYLLLGVSVFSCVSHRGE